VQWKTSDGKSTAPTPFRSNFRRLAGNLQVPLDAPIVLIHGPNGTGKTSILSAIELSLTGSIQSLERLDERYLAHLPCFGESYATVQIQTGNSGSPLLGDVMTVGSTGVDGTPALDPLRRQFYSERCYLDQVSLGRLLEMYQHTEANRESSLARFVNELLGLDSLDALISGLIGVTHVSKLRNLVEQYPSAEAESRQLGERLEAVLARRAEAALLLQTHENSLLEALSQLGYSGLDVDTENVTAFAERFLQQLPVGYKYWKERVNRDNGLRCSCHYYLRWQGRSLDEQSTPLRVTTVFRYPTVGATSPLPFADEQFRWPIEYLYPTRGPISIVE
jgi:hypothetical protein